MPQTEPEKNQWFAQEVHAHEASLRSYLRTAFPSVRDVDDLVQESYLRLWRARVGQPILFTKAFLFKVARHLALDLVRREGRSPLEAVTDSAAWGVIEDGPNPAEAACSEQALQVLAEAIASLPGRCREIFVLRKLKGMPQKEIAALLGLSEQTVQVQASRGLRRCAKFLRRRGFGVDDAKP